MTISIELLVFVCAILTLLGALVGFLLKKENRLTVIETKLDDLIDDVDAIALFVGTPRAIATKKKRKFD